MTDSLLLLLLAPSAKFGCQEHVFVSNTQWEQETQTNEGGKGKVDIPLKIIWLVASMYLPRVVHTVCLTSAELN